MTSAHDYEHALLEIRRRLHDPRGRKAAVMVGAGFSRNAVHRSDPSKKLPDWQELTRALAAKLYPGRQEQDDVLAAAGATSSAARLAQEYEVAFRRVGLIEFIRDAVCDQDFLPTSLHRKLLELPWSDVFTTNYDRLLETAARSLWKQHYELVTSINDLPLSRRARIIKLHGTLPDLADLVLTEEDYRTYPRKYAPFVTTVQAALTENVLCLIGFSGDDPNFLAWTGWLRDEMRSAVPHTYLFTGSELKPFQRQLLEERHIIPIPLRRIAPEADWHTAYSWLLDQLDKPPGLPQPSWNVGPRYANAHVDSDIAMEPYFPSNNDWIDAAILWRTHRLQYRGWYVLHRKGADRLEENTTHWLAAMTPTLLDPWPEPTALFVLHEVAWRWATALQPMYDPLVFTILDPQMRRFAEWRSQVNTRTCVIKGSSKEAELALSELDDAYALLLRECLRHAREIGDDKRFGSFLEQLGGSESAASHVPLNTTQSYVRHQQVLHALGRLRHVDARRLLESWNTNAGDLIWAARRAALCLECGMLMLGTRILESALDRLRSASISPNADVRSMSIEGIVLDLFWAARSAEKNSRNPSAPDANPTGQDLDGKSRPAPDVVLDRLHHLRNDGCDPNDQQEWLSEATAPEPRVTKGYFQFEGFEIGSVQSGSSMGAEPQLKAAYRAIRFIDESGIPIQIPLIVTTTIAKTLFRNALRTIAVFAPHEAVGLFLRARDDGLAHEILSRGCLARLSVDQVDSLFEASLQALREALRRLNLPPEQRDVEDEFWSRQVRVCFAVLGCVTVRLREDQSRALVGEIIKLPHHEVIRTRWQVQDALSVCIRRASRSMSRDALEEMLPALLATPVKGSAQLATAAGRPAPWHDPVAVIDEFSLKRDSRLCSKCEEEIDALLSRISRAQGEERVYLCLRAAYLLRARLLSNRQMSEYVSGLFAQTDEYGFPSDTGSFDALILLLPSRRDFDEVAAFRRKHFGNADRVTSWHELRRTCVHVRPLQDPALRPLKWARQDLTTILDLADSWLSGVKAPVAEKNAKHPLAALFERDAEEQTVFIDWLCTLENLVLLNRRSSQRQRVRANALIQKAEAGGWCVTQATPSRVLCGYVTEERAGREIAHYLGDRDPIKVQQACSAIAVWQALGHERKLPLRKELFETLTALVSERRHEQLPLLILTCKELILRSEHAFKVSVVRAIGDGLRELLVETEYGTDGVDSRFSIGLKLRTRVACATLAATAADQGISDPILARWADAIQSDIFADVRRAFRVE